MEHFWALVEKMIEVPLDDASVYLLCTLAGGLVNALYKCRREGIKVSSYWRDNLRSTFAAFAGAMAAFITTIILEPGVGKATYFAIGYMADSIINKPPLPVAVRTALDKLEKLQGQIDEKTTADNAAVPVGLQRESDAIVGQAAAATEKIERTFVAGELTDKARSNQGDGN